MKRDTSWYSARAAIERLKKHSYHPYRDYGEWAEDARIVEARLDSDLALLRLKDERIKELEMKVSVLP